MACGLAASPARARGLPVHCARPLSGPCRVAEVLSVLLPRNSQRVVVAANFGLIAPAQGTAWQFVCEETFDAFLSERVTATSEAVLMPTTRGLLRSADGCTWSAAGGSLAGQEVIDLAVEAGQIWALAPATLHRSVDGGRTFALVHVFGGQHRFTRLVVAGTRDVYVAGPGAQGPLVIGRSEDAGASWTFLDPAGGLTDTRQIVDLLAVAPGAPRAVYLGATNDQGDQIWRSDDAGTSARKILQLAPGNSRFGFTFGADARTLHVAGRDLFVDGTKPTGYLHTSQDGGETWAAPIPSGPTGPRYRCLGFRDGLLYACGAGEPGGDAFFLGASSDGGKTWRPVLRTRDITGAPTCARSICSATADWLCDSYGACDPGAADAGVPTSDGAAADATTDGIGGCPGGTCDGGCSCGVHRPRVPPPFWAAPLVAGWLLRRRRRRISP